MPQSCFYGKVACLSYGEYSIKNLNKIYVIVAYHFLEEYIYLQLYYTAQNNKCNFKVVRASLNRSARVTKSSIYFCETYILEPEVLVICNIKFESGDVIG